MEKLLKCVKILKTIKQHSRNIFIEWPTLNDLIEIARDGKYHHPDIDYIVFEVYKCRVDRMKFVKQTYDNSIVFKSEYNDKMSLSPYLDDSDTPNIVDYTFVFFLFFVFFFYTFYKIL